MDGGDGALPDQPLQSEGLKDKHSENVCKDGMEDAVTDKDTEDPFESQGDVGVHKGDGAELNADLSDSEVSESLLCDGVINMLRKILDTKQTREIVRNETLKRQRNNESQDNCAPPKAYSRCSVPYFLEVVKATCKSEKKVELVRSIGFPYLLELDDSVVPRSFAQWVADKVRVEDELIIIHDKKIPLNAESVFHVFGIPAGETIINTTDDGGKEEFLALFGLSEVPTIKYFGNKIIKEEELSDDQYIRCFMVVALATFLCPTSNTKPSTKYMGALLDVSKIKELNWCKFTHTWLIQAINKYQKEKMKPNKTTLTLGGCIYHLVVRCLDFIDFGPIQLQSTMPRICVWKGNLIKLFSEALLDKNGAYRACKIKNESETCYGLENHGWASTERHSYLKAAIEKAVGDAVNEKAKEDIYLSFQHYMKDEGPNTCSKVKQLILQVLQIVTIAACASEKTVRIESSSNQQNSTNVKHDSEATVKVNSNGEYIEEHEDIISRKKRRIGDEIGRSTNEAPETSLVKVRTLSQQSCGSVGTHSKAEQNLAGDEEKTNFQSCAFEFEQRITKEELQVAVGSLKLGEQETRTNVGVEMKQEDSHQDKFIHLKAGSTTSFDYMLCAQKFESTASHQQEQGLSTNSTTFVGFGENTTPQKEEPGNDQVPERMSIDINKVFVPDEDPSLTQTGQTAWARYLDESRKKYFFYDDDTPTLRLFENHDDCGNEIEEPELWRPLHMMSDAYERKIESAKRNGPASRTEGGDNFFSKEAKQSCKSTNQFQHQSSSTVKGFSVCCAQDQQSNSFICTPRPLTTITKDGTIIDLTSPKANDIFHWNQQQTCYTPGNKNNSHFSGATSHKTGATSHKTNMGSPSHTIVGRRLFHDEESHVHILDGTKQNPITFRDSQPASPEVQFLGERSLQEKCLNMLGNSDEHYNTRLFLGSTNSSVGKENIPPKRIVQPSRFRCSPYDDQDRGSLMSHEVELYSNIMILSRDPDFKGKWVVEIDNCRVSMEQLGNSFRDKGWVESYVINVFCRKLFRDNHPRVSQRHFFFHTASEYFLQKWKNEQARLMWKDKLIKSFIGAGKAKDLQLCNELFFPTLHENHWFVFLMDLCARKFIFLDSKYDEDSPYHRSIKHMLIENFKQAWNDAGLRNMGFRHYETAYPNLPKQDGCDACGIFVLKWLENWRSRNVLQTVFKQDNVKDARIRLAVDILFSKHNILEEGKRVVKNL